MEARTTAGILLVLTLLGLLSWLCLAQASKVSTVRYHIGEKEAERERLQRENAELLTEVMERLNVSHLENIALESGYIPAGELRYLDVPGYPGGVSGGGLAVATKDAVVAPEEPKGLGGSGMARWWGKVISQFVAWAGTQP